MSLIMIDSENYEGFDAMISALSPLELDNLRRELQLKLNLREEKVKNKSIIEICNNIDFNNYSKILIEYLSKIQRYDLLMNFSKFCKDHCKKTNKCLNEKYEYLKLKRNPYEFQLHLAQRGIEDINNIICLRTGAGKTFISAIICKHWYLKFEAENRLNEFKVAFIVPTRHLAEQQRIAFKESAFDENVLVDIDEKKTPERIAEYFKSYNIIFLTGNSKQTKTLF